MWELREGNGHFSSVGHGEEISESRMAETCWHRREELALAQDKQCQSRESREPPPAPRAGSHRPWSALGLPPLDPSPPEGSQPSSGVPSTAWDEQLCWGWGNVGKAHQSVSERGPARGYA